MQRKDFIRAEVGIIGAGVAGSYLAHLLSEEGIDVILIEESRKIKIDSGIVSTNIKNFLKIRDYLILDKIKEMNFFSSKSSFYLFSKKPFAYILKRKEFGKYLRKIATKSGAKLFYDECEKIKLNKDFYVIGKNNKYIFKILVGCDGANSIVRKFLGIDEPKFAIGFIHKLRKNLKIKKISVYHDKKYSKKFFGWIIPQNREIGLMTEIKDSKEKFSKFLKDKVNENFDNKDYFHLIPISTTKSFYKNAILVGDACGQTKPLTGGGIIYSLTCAEKAKDAIINYIEHNKKLEIYENLWKKEIYKEIMLQKFIRKIYEHFDNNQIDKIFREINKIELENFEYDSAFSFIKEFVRKEPKKAAKLFVIFFENLLSFF
jgi:geranylgeranyl reductase family protein